MRMKKACGPCTSSSAQLTDEPGTAPCSGVTAVSTTTASGRLARMNSPVNTLSGCVSGPGGAWTAEGQLGLVTPMWGWAALWSTPNTCTLAVVPGTVRTWSGPRALRGLATSFFAQVVEAPRWPWGRRLHLLAGPCRFPPCRPVHDLQCYMLVVQWYP